jgi:hypothetical protein
VFVPVRVSCELALFWTTPVTEVLMTALIAVVPEPLPLLVTVPVLPTAVPETVIPFVIVLLLFRIRFPVPVVPPDNVNSEEPLALLLVSVVPPLLTVRAPLTVKAEVVLFSVTAVTFVPTAAVIVAVAVLLPALVIVPVLLTATVVKLVVPLVPVLLIVMLPVPPTPPEKVRLFVVVEATLRLLWRVIAPLKIAAALFVI